ncbi:hypothetical protein F2P56_006235 [Juglans regia]|uniref:Uncharacterized protein n=1 Tax=Juglans regia TaxID=51240 RepID=A0A833XQP0_JUGRE|nr:hypothetical protein F2P56_006235 [Juglans regia]
MPVKPAPLGNGLGTVASKDEIEEKNGAIEKGRESAKHIVGVKELIDKKASYVQMDLRLKDIGNRDHAAKIMSTPEAEKYYTEAALPMDEKCTTAFGLMKHVTWVSLQGNLRVRIVCSSVA